MEYERWLISLTILILGVPFALALAGILLAKLVEWLAGFLSEKPRRRGW